MASQYTVELTSVAAKQLRKLDRSVQRRILTALDVLKTEPRPPAVKALAGHPDYLRARLGDYRIVYTIVDDRLLVLVLALGDRKSVYRSL